MGSVYLTKECSERVVVTRNIGIAVFRIGDDLKVAIKYNEGILFLHFLLRHHALSCLSEWLFKLA